LTCFCINFYQNDPTNFSERIAKKPAELETKEKTTKQQNNLLKFQLLKCLKRKWNDVINHFPN